MRLKIKSCIAAIELLLESGDTAAIKASLAFYKKWLAYFQHERLIHLIVTAFFSLIAVICTLYTMFAATISGIFNVDLNLFIYALDMFFIIMSAAYIRHYYILENGVQRIYDLIDLLEGKVAGH